ncbi:MAG: PIN domain nuclease [Geminicoccaceae bacterium]
MIVVDSTVWIDFFRGRSTVGTDKLRSCIGHGVVIVGDLVLAEVLQGFPDERQAQAGRQTLERFQFEPMVGREVALMAAGNYRRLRGLGFTVRRTIDLLIGSYCLLRGHALLHNDRDYDPMAEFLGLRVV